MSGFRRPTRDWNEKPSAYVVSEVLKAMKPQCVTPGERRALDVGIDIVRKHIPAYRHLLLAEFTTQQLQAEVQRRQAGQGGT